MRMKITLSCLLLLFLHVDARAYYCGSPSAGDAENNLINVISNSTYVFIGEVNTTKEIRFQIKGDEERLSEVVVSFSVTKVLKGELKAEEYFFGRELGVMTCSCNYDFEPGVEYIVFGSPHGAKKRLSACSHIRVNDREMDYLEEVLSAFEQWNSGEYELRKDN